ncbi:VRR-NUC domain-containing protein [Hutsoniella sourekii]|uniref:VRR-NUC domain-containing protein n=1 Tax=Hutsoniella sourekii TaxID=87650 RepID=UPI0004895C94|nr:VRR-NUC domain-containing protein [Hutsoniella sourekii]
MREKQIEEKLRQAVTERGGLAIKFISPSLTGIPDRLLLMPGGKLAFVEVKQPGGKVRKIQNRRIEQLQDLGFKCYVLDSLLVIPKIMEEVVADELHTP